VMDCLDESPFDISNRVLYEGFMMFQQAGIVLFDLWIWKNTKKKIKVQLSRDNSNNEAKLLRMLLAQFIEKDAQGVFMFLLSELVAGSQSCQQQPAYLAEVNDTRRLWCPASLLSRLCQGFTPTAWSLLPCPLGCCHPSRTCIILTRLVSRVTSELHSSQVAARGNCSQHALRQTLRLLHSAATARPMRLPGMSLMTVTAAFKSSCSQRDVHEDRQR